jgi:hypothetical protein
MLHQKTVIYIILSAILLYLYYLRRDLAVFAAFAVVVAGTLIVGKDLDSIEGMTRRRGGGGGGGGGGGCANMGFTAPKIKKDDDGDLGESLETEIKKIKEIADKYWPYDMKGDSDKENEKEIIKKYYGVFAKIVQENKFSKDENTTFDIFMETCKSIYEQVNSSDKSKRKQLTIKASDLPKGYLKEIVSVANKFHVILNKVRKSDELKDAGAKKLARYLSCLCKHWITIFTEVDNLATGKALNSSKNEDKSEKE